METTKVFKQFQEFWKAGKDARLNLECHAGQVWLHLQVHLPQPPPPQPYHPHPPRQGPSRLRRRARRAEARAQAAENATKLAATEEVAVQTNEEEIKTADAAVQAAFDDQPAVFSNHATQFLYPFPPPHIPDELCHDQVYAAAAQAEVRHQPSPPPYIPQVDGAADQTLDQGHVWSCKCCMYEKLFETEDELQRHHNGPDDRGDPHFLQYDECNICYPWHVWS